jgi:Transglutaminase-like superfamily
MSEAVPVRLSLPEKVALALRVWRSYVVVLVSLRRAPLARLAQELGEEPVDAERRPPELLSHAVARCLRVGRYQPRCLITSLVLFKLLREQGDRPELVIGLHVHAVDHRAHAWIEIDGRDVGPPPGSRGHEPLARYGPAALTARSTPAARPTP